MDYETETTENGTREHDTQQPKKKRFQRREVNLDPRALFARTRAMLRALTSDEDIHDAISESRMQEIERLRRDIKKYLSMTGD
jgi:hypothetical protein